MKHHPPFAGTSLVQAGGRPVSRDGVNWTWIQRLLESGMNAGRLLVRIFDSQSNEEGSEPSWSAKCGRSFYRRVASSSKSKRDNPILKVEADAAKWRPCREVSKIVMRVWPIGWAPACQAGGESLKGVRFSPLAPN